jgi:hypothetical protein
MKTFRKWSLLGVVVFILCGTTGCFVFVEAPLPPPPPHVHFYYYDYDYHPHCCR